MKGDCKFQNYNLFKSISNGKYNKIFRKKGIDTDCLTDTKKGCIKIGKY